MCGVVPPSPLINPLIDSAFEAIRTSPVSAVCMQSWRARLKALPLFQSEFVKPQGRMHLLNNSWQTVFYFRQLPLSSEAKLLQILEEVSRCLDDENIEVREMAVM